MSKVPYYKIPYERLKFYSSPEPVIVKKMERCVEILSEIRAEEKVPTYTLTLGEQALRQNRLDNFRLEADKLLTELEVQPSEAKHEK